MNGATLGSKQIVVRLYEPKQLRQEKLAQRFGTPDLSSAGASTATSSATSPAPVASISASEPSYTIASLAKLPAAEIVRLANSSSATGLPLPKADPLIVQATDEFIDQLISKPPAMQKQSLGEKLYVFLFLFFPF